MAMLGHEWSKGDTDRSGIDWQSLKLRRIAAGVPLDMVHSVHGRPTVRGLDRTVLCSAVLDGTCVVACA